MSDAPKRPSTNPNLQPVRPLPRLIRSTADRGAVVILDRRVTDMIYGRSFLAALPKGIGMTRNLEDVERYFQ